MIHTTVRKTLEIEQVFLHAADKGYAVALWRLPAQTEEHLLADFSGQPDLVHPDPAQLPEGFLVGAFHRPDGRCWHLRKDLYLRFESGGQLPESAVANYLAESGRAGEAALLLEQVMRQSTQPASLIDSWKAHAAVRPSDTPATQPVFEELVRQGIEAIRREEFQKVVLSRFAQVALPSGFSATELYRRLCQAYPNAFVALVALPGAGVWITATPELLLSADQRGMFRTVALAGTQLLQPGSRPQDAAWKQKEIEEQAMVSRYIINCFKKIRLREFEEIGPRTVQAGHLLHLRTDFSVDTSATNFPQLAGVMLELLHPTSAVCGMPKAPSMAFILENEGYDRALYSGWLGPVNLHGETRLFVHLRTMQLLHQHALLYAGAGITADSVPEKEWTETALKMQTVLGQMSW